MSYTLSIKLKRYTSESNFINLSFTDNHDVLNEEGSLPKNFITHELLFMRCRNWSTPQCPHQQNAVMALAAINQEHLFLLADETVAKLRTLCRACPSFQTKQDRLS